MLLIISQRLQEHQKLPAVSDDKHKIPADNRRAATVHIFAQLIVKFPADKPTYTHSSNHHMSAVGDVFSRLMNRNISPLHIHFLNFPQLGSASYQTNQHLHHRSSHILLMFAPCRPAQRHAASLVMNKLFPLMA